MRTNPTRFAQPAANCQRRIRSTVKRRLKLLSPRYGRPLAALSVLGLVLAISAWANLSSLAPSKFHTLTADEQQILKIKKSDPQGKLSHYDLIARTAVPTDKLEIWQCQVRPVVIRLKIGQMLTYVNFDNVPHQIQSDLAHNYAV